jgi:bifunctional enzyme CysN/CysC
MVILNTRQLRCFRESEFIEAFIDTSLEESERRDVKGLYAKARRGELQSFTGVDGPYKPPKAPKLVTRPPVVR